MEREIIGCTNAELAAAALLQWKLPQAIQEAVRDQYHPAPSTCDTLSLSYLLGQAHRIVNGLDVMIPACACQLHSGPDAMLAGLGLEAQSGKILEEYKGEFGAMRSFF